MNLIKKTITVLAVSSLALITSPVAHAAPGDSVTLYLSAPLVTGSHVTDGVTENFNVSGTGTVPCPTTIPGFATLTFAPGTCAIGIQSGTSGGNFEQAVGVPLSSYVTRTLDTTFTFTNSVKYVGFWWMMGSSGNNVDFIEENGTQVASFDAGDVVAQLGANNLVSNADTRTISNLDGGTYLRKHFYRSPANYSGTVQAPVMNYDVDSFANEPWVYLNLYVTGSIDIKKVRFRGANFEMDNLTVSSVESKPKGTFVAPINILGTPPALQRINWSPTNTEVTETNPEHTPSSAAAVTSPVTGGGALTYSVQDAGNTGCTVDASTGVITYTGIGACVIRATAAAVPGQFYEETKDVTFNFTALPDEPEVTPEEETGNENEGGGELAETGSGMSSIALYSALSLLILGLVLLRLSNRRAKA